MDYGTPVGYRIASKHPERIKALIVQNGNAYEDGLREFREHQPPTLIVWGKNDPIFPAEGAHPYVRDLKTIEFHLLDTGHFALEEDGDVIAGFIRHFLRKHWPSRPAAGPKAT